MNENDLSAVICKMLDQYFADLDGEKPSGVYNMVLSCVEKPLLELILEKAGGNQTLAAEYLGLNRHTLRKKMQQHGLK